MTPEIVVVLKSWKISLLMIHDININDSLLASRWMGCHATVLRRPRRAFLLEFIYE